MRRGSNLLLLLLLLAAACRKPVSDAPVDAEIPPPPQLVATAEEDLPIARPTRTTPFVAVATFGAGVTPNATSLGDAVAVLQFGPSRWTLSGVGASHKRVDLIARIPAAMRPLDEQPLFVGGNGIDDMWLSTATGTLHVTPRATTTSTGHLLKLGSIGGRTAGLTLDGEDRSLGWLTRETAAGDAGALPKLPPAHRLSDEIAFLGEGRICGRSESTGWLSGTDGAKETIALGQEHRDAHVYRGPRGECVFWASGEDGTFIGRIRERVVAWKKIAPRAITIASPTRSGSLVFVLGDALVRVAIGTALSLTAVPLPEDAKRVTTLVALDDDDIWFTGPQGGSREALFHTASADAGAATEWPAP